MLKQAQQLVIGDKLLILLGNDRSPYPCEGMSISEKTICAIVQSYKEDFGLVISHEEARETAERLLMLYRLLARTTPVELAAMKKRNEQN